MIGYHMIMEQKLILKEMFNYSCLSYSIHDINNALKD